MPLFVCDDCGCVENTACVPDFWGNHCHGVKVLCSECGVLKKWHGAFPKKKWDGKREVYNRNQITP